MLMMGPVGKARCQKDALSSGHVRSWPKRGAFTFKFAFCDAASEFEEPSSFIELRGYDTPAPGLPPLRRMAYSSAAKGDYIIHRDVNVLQ
jgi:hypothetical protein